MTAVIENLPFVSGPTEVRNLWDVKPSFDFAADCSTGRQYAEDLTRMIRAGDLPPPTLGYIVQAMPPAARWTGVETGFFQRIADLASR